MSWEPSKNGPSRLRIGSIWKSNIRTCAGSNDKTLGTTPQLCDEPSCKMVEQNRRRTSKEKNSPAGIRAKKTSVRYLSPPSGRANGQIAGSCNSSRTRWMYGYIAFHHWCQHMMEIFPPWKCRFLALIKCAVPYISGGTVPGTGPAARGCGS